jgi:hypothetical protein
MLAFSFSSLQVRWGMKMGYLSVDVLQALQEVVDVVLVLLVMRPELLGLG